MTQPHHIRTGLLGALLAGAIVLTGCSSSSIDDAQPAAPDATIDLLPPNDEIIGFIPEGIREKGTITWAIDGANPPSSSVGEDGKTLVGNEVDFALQISSILGLEPQLVNVGFDAIIPGLQAGRYDAAIAGFRVTLERQEVVDFVSYAKSGPQLFTKAGNSGGITTLDGLCGTSIAMQTGTIQLAVVQEQAEKCLAEGRSELRIDVYKSQSEQVQAVVSGRSEYGAQNAPANVYLEEQTSGALVGVGDLLTEGTWGIALPKDTGLLGSIHLATEKLLGSPQYHEILEKWGVTSQQITSSEINNATS